MHVRDWGGAGTPLVLLHGLASGARIWDFIAPILANHFRVVAVDQRGHGLTDKPRDAYGFPEVTGDVLALVDELGFDRSVVIGHSWGASVATQFASDHPERTRGLVMVDGGIMDISERMSWEQAEKQMRPPEIDGAPLDGFLNAVRSFPDFAELWSDELQEMFLSNFEVREGRVYRRLPIDQHMTIVRAMYDQGTSALLGHIEAPALVILAEREPKSEIEQRWMEWRRNGAELAKQKLKFGRVIWMQDSIHDVPIQRPDEVAREIIGFGSTLA
jgi:pimeloyl-ACP methyl ester carboxylesterase